MGIAGAKLQRWTPDPPAQPRGDRPTVAIVTPKRADITAAGLMVATIVFNPALAFVNGHVAPVGTALVALAQTMIVFAAIVLVVVARPPGVARWIMYGWLTLTLWILLTMVRGVIEPKIAGDILLVPAFAALGLCMRRETLFRTLVLLQIVLVVFVVWELFFPTSFGNFFQIRDYYVATRGFTADVFWGGEDNLFVSAQRPGGRLLRLGLDLNRGSSLFLEPVTLGNWTIVVSIALATFWKDVSGRMRAILIATNIALLIGCDGRLAMAVNALILVTMPIYNRLPNPRRWLPVLYLPIIYLILFFALTFNYLDGKASYDDLKGRYANSIQYLTSSGLEKLFAARPGGTAAAADSGWLHIILTQSIFGLFAFWLAMTTMGGSGPRGTRYAHAVAIYVALALPISDSVLSIKAAAAMWMILGCAWTTDRMQSAPST